MANGGEYIHEGDSESKKQNALRVLGSQAGRLERNERRV